MAAWHVLRPDQQAEWMDVLAQSFRYDFYHLPHYHALAELRGEGLAQLFVYTEGPYAIAVPLLLRPLATVPGLADLGAGWWDATSVYGYAGPIGSHPDIPAAIV